MAEDSLLALENWELLRYILNSCNIHPTGGKVSVLRSETMLIYMIDLLRSAETANTSSIPLWPGATSLSAAASPLLGVQIPTLMQSEKRLRNFASTKTLKKDQTLSSGLLAQKTCLAVLCSV